MSVEPPLLHSPADILSQVVVGLNLGSDPTLGQAWPVYVSNEPSTPDEVLTCYDTVWRDDGRIQITGETTHHFGVQVRVRARTFRTGYAKAEAIRTYFDEQVNDMPVHLDGAVYIVHSISDTDVKSLGKDASNSQRSLFTMNCYATLTRVS